MFHQITPHMQNRMQHLEKIDTKEKKVQFLFPVFQRFARVVRRDRARNIVRAIPGVARLPRLCQITPDTGRLLTLLAANAPSGSIVEIGTSAGYSAMWLALACRQRGTKLVTFEIQEVKSRMARETFHLAGVEDVVELVEGDAQDLIKNYEDIAFCFLDASKEIYLDCYEAVIPKLVSGGLLVADNVKSHEGDVLSMLKRALQDVRVDVLMVPIGSGVLVCRKV